MSSATQKGNRTNSDIIPKKRIKDLMLDLDTLERISPQTKVEEAVKILYERLQIGSPLFLLVVDEESPGAAVGAVRTINVDNALGMVIGLPNRCVGCRRCELACTEYNEGFSQPTMARINVRRNFNFGPSGAQLGFWRGEGRYGNHRFSHWECTR